MVLNLQKPIVSSSVITAYTILPCSRRQMYVDVAEGALTAMIPENKQLQPISTTRASGAALKHLLFLVIQCAPRSPFMKLSPTHVHQIYYSLFSLMLFS